MTAARILDEAPLDSEFAIQDERTGALFGECPRGCSLLEYGVCPVCQADEHARRHAGVVEGERARIAKDQAAFAERNKPNGDMADLLEQRRDALQFVGLCRALRNGEASYAQIRLARRLTQPRAMKRARKART